MDATVNVVVIMNNFLWVKQSLSGPGTCRRHAGVSASPGGPQPVTPQTGRYFSACPGLLDPLGVWLFGTPWIGDDQDGG
jgi:hypothetical protein